MVFACLKAATTGDKDQTTGQLGSDVRSVPRTRWYARVRARARNTQAHAHARAQAGGGKILQNKVRDGWTDERTMCVCTSSARDSRRTMYAHSTRISPTISGDGGSGGSAIAACKLALSHRRPTIAGRFGESAGREVGIGLAPPRSAATGTRDFSFSREKKTAG